MRRLALAAGGFAVALLAAACSSSGGGGSPTPMASDLVGQNQVAHYQGAGLVPPQPRPSFTLRDTSGKPFAFATRTAGHPTFLYFGYTHCPDECPATMADLRLALKQVPASVAAQTYVVFVTTDVKRDSAPVIQNWLHGYDADSRATWVGLRGTQAQIDAAQAAAHIAIAEDKGEMHSTEVLLFGSDDYAHVAFLRSSNEQQQMAHDLPIVADESS
ncbi:MAG TPA: SCO family protein [Jatrophihabitans sp.]|jgi:protein SCO1/2|nr:SCO family protein [Jatrophihabitans sp.]